MKNLGSKRIQKMEMEGLRVNACGITQIEDVEKRKRLVVIRNVNDLKKK